MDDKPESPHDRARKIAGLFGANDRIWDALKSSQLPATPAPDVSADVPEFPADPFGETDAAGIAIAEMYWSMLKAGIPLASVEKILGQMLACLPQPGE